MKINKWTLTFLSITGLAIAFELIYAFDKNPNTLPWTQLIVNNVPSWIGLPIMSAFAVWLVYHFIIYYGVKK